MSVPTSDRPLEKVKEEVIDQLILNYSHGEISADAFERRLDQAYACDAPDDLTALTADLPLQTDPRYQAEKLSCVQPKFTASTENNAQLNITSILSSDNRSGAWVVPKDIYIKNYSGSVTLDFRNAVFTHPNVTIHIDCILGSDAFIVPDNIDVTTSTKNILGSVNSDKSSLENVTVTGQRPHLHIKGRVILGSVDVTMKQSMKQSLKQFADHLKDLFDDQSKRNKSH
ncbi:DUF1707 SHOCT-like domain-containing protein [Pseudoalteromonas aurantia]|uniref:Uncharacterized protein n=1 Tax=Pseudoalteromonas aurantia TaxID=43654 RepID=A0A5S3VA31_9GAMM|nr:LiaF domain-containing protein [Pseudoalteromonas aurantia]TMO64167.1 hypothetical protein CWC18_06985 [Pseudoalteromonas aurantia]TMO68553.1 hypothetical protein CWC19_09065 [Pseudoalteromonas aurantia]TMO75156.1 hypothetical protein CWC20_08505 [Pseudoalteromonas aurantia]